MTGRSLGDDQLAAVATITAATKPVAVLVGPAGTGKTFTLDAVRAAFELAGHRVVGAAPSARAAIELSAGAGISARTLHSLLDQWRRGFDAPQPGSLLLVDEAGMADVRTLEAVVTGQLAAGGRVLLAGDHHQLPEVGAGGGFAAAAVHAGCVAELSVNRRQRQPWEQAALTDLRDGSVARAVEAYLTHGRVVVTDNPETMITAAVDRWFAARDAGLSPVLLAGTNDLVERLNQAVIGRLSDAGELDGTPATFGLGSFRVGERVVARRNSTEHTVHGHAVDVANGQAGHVVAIGPDGLTVRMDRGGEELVLTDRYLRRGGHLTHGYALTTHRAQGGTWDLAIGVGADGLYREGGYVELSRGAAENWLVLTDPEAAQLHQEAIRELERHDTGLTPPDDEAADTRDDLIERVGRSRAKQLAHTLDLDVERVDDLARTVALADLEAHVIVATAAERIATETHGVDGADLADRIACVNQIARHVFVGCQVSPSDRHNVGIVIALDDAAGQATVQFVSADGREATRTFHWADLRMINPTAGTSRTPPEAARDRLDTIVGELSAGIERWQATVCGLGAEPGDAARYVRAIDRAIDRQAQQLSAERPGWLDELIGDRPADVAGATTWDDAVRQIAHWRARHQLPDHTTGLGQRPTHPDDALPWDKLHTRLGLTRTWLASTDRIHTVDTIVPSRTELLERRAELDGLLAVAPADWRTPITELRSGQLSLDDTAGLLQAALDGQQTRRDWIILNWPHVVEYQEINRTLTTATWGPDPGLLTDLVTSAVSDALADAIEHLDPWLRAALALVADGNTTRLDDEAIQHLERRAAFRAEQGIAPSAPLDGSWWPPGIDLADGYGIEHTSVSVGDGVDL